MFMGLGFPAGGYDDMTVTAISADGSTVVGHVKDDIPSGLPLPDVAFRWTESTGAIIFAPPGTPDVSFARKAFDVSEDGSVIVGSITLGQGDAGNGFTWSEDTGLVLVEGRALRISDDGSTIVGRGGFDEPFRDGPGPLELLPIPNGLGSGGQATAVSADGKIVVGDFVPDDDSLAGSRVVVWDEAGLPTLAPLTATLANGISADGSTAVGLSNPGEDGSDEDRAYRLDVQTNTVQILESFSPANPGSEGVRGIGRRRNRRRNQ